jgi:2-polyprenyl-3-methyl-5-hydroxy-6-metoxy-1,4-benzoquinol methylase
MIAPPLERVNPDRSRWFLRGVIAGHVARYEHARREAARGKRVLDLACGSGYGCAILSDVAASVVGVDLDAAALVECARRHRLPNVRFVAGDARAVPLASGQFDLVTSFETIEHLPERDVDTYLDELHRLLVPGGRLLISTPDRDSYSLGGRTGNPFHFFEFTRAEFAERLSRRFELAEMFGQDFAPGWQVRAARAVARGPLFRLASRGWRAYKMVVSTSAELVAVERRPRQMPMVLVADARKR